MASSSPYALTFASDNASGDHAGAGNYGFTTYCYQCKTYQQALVTTEIKVRQSIDCTTALYGAFAGTKISAPGTFRSDTNAVAYDSSSPKELFANGDLMFHNTHKTDCGALLICSVLPKTCTGTYSGGKITTNGQGGLLMKTDEEFGYIETVCVRCYNTDSKDSTE